MKSLEQEDFKRFEVVIEKRIKKGNSKIYPLDINWNLWFKLNGGGYGISALHIRAKKVSEDS